MLPSPLDLSQRSSRVSTIGTGNYDDTDKDEEPQQHKKFKTGEKLINKLIEKKFLEMERKSYSGVSSLKGKIFFFFFQLLRKNRLCLINFKNAFITGF